MSSNTKNYTAQGGSVTVIGGELQILGKLTIAPDAKVEGLFTEEAQLLESVSLELMESQPDSTATTTAALRADFNALLGKLRAAGLLADEGDDADTPITDEIESP